MISADAIIKGNLTSTERDAIRATVARLGKAMMTPSAHGYRAEANETIMDAAERGTKHFGNNSKASSAIAIMSVILAANRNYNKQVKKHVQRMWDDHPALTLKELANITKEAGTALKFKEVWGHNDEKKFCTLKEVLAVFIPDLGDANEPANDHRVVSNWAKNAQLSTMHQDPIGSLRNIGVATFQHLRMNFGVNTVKPDQRVKEVLEREFNLRLSDKKAILVVESIAKIGGVKTLLIDQIFVKYGSGYYVK